MFSFKKLLKKISKLAWTDTKKAQFNHIEAPTETFTSHIDEAIDRGESAVDALYEGGHRDKDLPEALQQQQPASMDPKDFINAEFIRKVRDYLSWIDPKNPLDFSNKISLPIEWKERPMLDTFQIIAREVMKHEYHFSEKILDEIISAIILEPTSMIGEKIETEHDIKTLPNDLLRNKYMTDEKAISLLERLSKYNNEFVVSSPTGKQKNKFPIEWVSDEMKLFRDMMVGDTPLRQKVDEKLDKQYNAVFNKIKSWTGVSLPRETIKKNYDNNLLKSSLSRFDWYNVKTDRIMRGKDFPVTFFTQREGTMQNPGEYRHIQHIPPGLDPEQIKRFKKNPDSELSDQEYNQYEQTRVKLMRSMQQLIQNSDEDLINYILAKNVNRTSNELRDEIRGTKGTSLDFEATDDGGSIGQTIGYEESKERMRGVREDDPAIKRWEDGMKRYAPDSYGQGGIANRIYNNFGQELTSKMTSEIDKLAQTGLSPKKVAEMNKNADLIEVIMMMTGQQVTDLFKPDTRVKDDTSKYWSTYNDKGLVKFNKDDNSAAVWSMIINNDYLQDTFRKVGELKKYILSKGDQYTPSKSLGENLSRELMSKGEKNPVILGLLSNEDFIERTRKMDIGSVDELYFNEKRNTGKALKTRLATVYQSIFHLIMPILVKRQKEIDTQFADNPQRHQIETQKFINERRILVNILGVHSQLKETDDEAFEEKVEKPIKEWRRKTREWKAQGEVGEPPKKPRVSLGLNISKALSRLMGGKITNNRDAYLMMTGHKPLPMDILEAHNCFIYKIYKQSDRIVSKLIEAKNRFEKMSIINDIDITINTVGTYYADRIKKLRK